MSAPRGMRCEDREKVEQAAAPGTMCIQHSYKIIILEEKKMEMLTHHPMVPSAHTSPLEAVVDDSHML